ncbi:unnamed protein product [Paramecium primaurelia]|uniref:Transmembrane protein n=1 Tax=Paramecium primaurelia TaxID=5886 RepID=A0A8S1NER8_PARPR|nr:unnamed protein product [Paramecium primaurelia]
MFIESIDHSTPRTIGDNEIQEQEYDQKINYKLEVRKSHLLQQFLRFQVENTQKSIVKLKKKISDDEVIIELTCQYIILSLLLYLYICSNLILLGNKQTNLKKKFNYKTIQMFNLHSHLFLKSSLKIALKIETF